MVYGYETVFVLESLFTPKNSFTCVGIATDFPDLLQIRNGVTESLYPSISVSSLLS